jgi:hypothetical protein
MTVPVEEADEAEEESSSLGRPVSKLSVSSSSSTSCEIDGAVGGKVDSFAFANCF